MPLSTSATILVLEENAAILELIDQTVRASGHRALGTRDALEAIDVVRRVRIDIVVAGTLLGKPRPTLIAKLRSIQPGLRIVSICDTDGEPQEIDNTVRLSTPFSLDDLREAIVASLNHRGDP